MAENALTAEYRCGYCYKEFNSMTDPRELPCHHVFCKTCIQGDYRDNNNICCPSCQRVHDTETFEALPKATLEAKSVVNTPTSQTCDVHNCDGQMAVCYCVECAHKICDTHRQNHDSFFGDKHKVIAISAYEMSPGQYKKVLCKDHNYELIKACENCKQLACLECDIYGGVCKDAQHRFCSLNKLKEQITAYFIEPLQSANEKLTEICKVDKQIWKILDDEEVECKERIEMIERIRDKQIETIREESEKLKEQIYEYQRRLTEQVELYNSELMVKKERLEDSRTKVHRWLRESHVTEKIQQKRQMAYELWSSTAIDTDCELKKTPLLIKADKGLSVHASLVCPPTSVTFKSEHQIGTECYSASYKDNGDLFLGCQDGVRHLKEGSMEMIKYDINCVVLSSVIPHGRNVFILHRTDDARIVDMYISDLKQKKELLAVQHSGDTTPHAAVSDRYLIATNPLAKELSCYDFITERTAILQLETEPSALHFMLNGDLLVTHSQELVRYRIQNDQLKEVWTCEGLTDAYGVCADADGLIYVSADNGLLYIISPDGTKLLEFKNDRLPDNVGEISIRGRDELAVSSWDGGSVCLFEINH